MLTEVLLRFLILFFVLTFFITSLLASSKLWQWYSRKISPLPNPGPKRVIYFTLYNWCLMRHFLGMHGHNPRLKGNKTFNRWNMASRISLILFMLAVGAYSFVVF